MKPNDKVKYIGVRQKEIVGCVGIVIALKDDNEFEEYNLRKDEALVDFGSEDDCFKVVRFPQLEIVEKEKKHGHKG